MHRNLLLECVSFSLLGGLIALLGDEDPQVKVRTEASRRKNELHSNVDVLIDCWPVELCCHWLLCCDCFRFMLWSGLTKSLMNTGQKFLSTSVDCMYFLFIVNTFILTCCTMM